MANGTYEYGGFNAYEWSVTFDDGSKVNYSFTAHDGDPWTVILRKFGKFLQGQGYPGVEHRIEELCEEFESELEARLNGRLAFDEFHGGDADN